MKMLQKILLWVAVILAAAVLMLVLTVVIARLINASKNKIRTENGIQESTCIDIDGMKQFIQIRGEDADNPVMIFLHGGPASPMSFVSAWYQRELEKDVTIINYDQRGCGRTYYANGCDANTNAQLLLGDLDAIVDYARERFHQDKVIITGHSWGTALGTIYVQQHPEKVLCYIGIGQMTDGTQDKLMAAEIVLGSPEIRGTEDEHKLTMLVRKIKGVQKFENLDFGDLMSLTATTAKYWGREGQQSGLAQIWSGLSSPDMSLTDMRWFLSQLNTEKFVAKNTEIMKYAILDFKLSDLSTTYEVPVYYIGGEGDFVVCQYNAKAYYETITAPDKAFYWLKNVGHSPFMDNPKLYCDTVKSILERVGVN